MQERRELSRNVYGLDNDIIERLFALGPQDRERLFTLYGATYGADPGNYAREAWPSWRSKSRGISGQVAGRFISIAPQVLPHGARYEIVAKLYEKTRRRETHSLTAVIGISEGAFRDLEDLFNRLCQKPFEHEWPDNLLQFANWLCQNDATAAKNLIAAIDAERSVLIVSAARVECDRLVFALKNLESAFAGTHTINLPYGTIWIRIRKPNWLERIKKAFS